MVWNFQRKGLGSIAADSLTAITPVRRNSVSQEEISSRALTETPKLRAYTYKT